MADAAPGILLNLPGADFRQPLVEGLVTTILAVLPGMDRGHDAKPKELINQTVCDTVLSNISATR